MRKRTIPVMLYLSAEENEQLNYDLHRTGLKKSQYLRALIMKQEIRERLPIDYYHMLTEISRIGNNINQIARIANQIAQTHGLQIIIICTSNFDISIVIYIQLNEKSISSAFIKFVFNFG